jgi:hypothetical protein
MAVTLQRKRNSRKQRMEVNIHQNSFSKGYISTIDNSRRPLESFSDMTNMEIVQDSVVRPRPPLVRYGTQPANTVIGRAEVRYNDTRSIYWMQNVAGVGKIYKQTDGGAFSLVGGTYDDEAWAGGVQSKGKLYLYNGVNNLSFVNLATDSVNTYTALTTPGTPTPTKTGMAGTSISHYYRISANNAVGESIASTAGTVTSGKIREAWVENTDFITVTWSTVTNATSYTIYYGDDPLNCYELYTVSGNATTTFIDYGTLAVNTFKLAPEGNSTQGAIFTWMYSDTKNSQIFGVTADNYLYYSAPGTGDFSPYNGGGYVGIDVDGDTTLNFVTGFRNGKGDPVLTVSARGAAGKGKIYHVSFDSLTVGDQIIVYPNVYEANGQSGTYAPRATLKEKDSIFYPTGQDFRSTGTSQNIVNILTTATISQVIEPDVERISLDSLHKAVGVSYKDRLYFSLPVGSTENNEIWYLDLSRKNLWVLRWPIAAKDMWLYEDNEGQTHFCVLVDNVILEFTRAGSRSHTDDDEAFRSRLSFESLKWDEDGLSVGSIRNMYFKFLFPKGNVQVNTTGLTRRGAEQSTGSATFTVSTTATGIGQWQYGGAFQAKDAAYSYGDDPGEINTYGKSVAVLKIKPRGLLNQLDYEVVSETAGSDYILSAVNTRGFALDQLTLKTGD